MMLGFMMSLHPGTKTRVSLNTHESNIDFHDGANLPPLVDFSDYQYQQQFSLAAMLEWQQELWPDMLHQYDFCRLNRQLSKLCKSGDIRKPILDAKYPHICPNIQGIQIRIYLIKTFKVFFSGFYDLMGMNMCSTKFAKDGFQMLVRDYVRENLALLEVSVNEYQL